MRREFWIASIISIIVSITLSLYINKLFWILVVVVFIFVFMGLRDLIQTKHAIKSNFPVLGRLRYVFEALRPKMYQYFIESDLDGRPINRISRAVIYQRAKKVRDTIPFGTQLDVYEVGYEWMNHSINALEEDLVLSDPRVLVGNKDCKKPYSASIFNISAMSYGSLSKNAIEALNLGAYDGGFAHNTGEGGVSPYHLKHNGDLIYQVGTGYFGCRAEDGNFDPDKFKKTVNHKNIKMVELKISQGAKPGHGGILPAVKNNTEIAEIRGVKPHTAVLSPPGHKAFNNFGSLVEFINQLRQLSDGLPVGIKLCLGDRREFVYLCKAMVAADTYPDFISVDGGEGGTGAAPVEFSNSMGTPLIDGLVFVHNTLCGFDIKKHIKIFASGKAITAFDIIKMISLGADAVYSARSMMLALGCIQALECNTNHCPTGITTHKSHLVKGLDVFAKAKRVHSYHEETIHAFCEMLGAAGIKDVTQLKRSHIFRRLNETSVMRFDQIYPDFELGQFSKDIPVEYKPYF